jgi:hypothetical protein
MKLTFIEEEIQNAVLELSRGKVSDPILIPYESDAPPLLRRKYIEALLALNIPIVYKLRNDVPKHAQLKGIEDLESKVVVDFHVSRPISLVCGFYSTLLYEAVEQGIPVATFTSPVDYAKRFVEKKLFNSVDLDTVKEDIEKAQTLSPEEVNHRKSVLVSLPFEPTFRAILRKYL